MKIRVCRIEDGPARVEVIDPSDGAIAQCINVDVGKEVTIVATTANSPADIEVGEVVANLENVDVSPEDTVGEAVDSDVTDGAQDTASTAEGAEEAASGSSGTQTPITRSKGVSEPDAA